MFNDSFLKTLNVLYIESDKNTGKHFFNILKKIFNHVSYAQTSVEALKNFDENKKINIVICDIFLEDDKGTNVLRKFREKDEDIPFILTTKETTTSDLLEAIKLNADDFLIKPIQAKDLILAVEKICYDKYKNEMQEQTTKDLNEMIEVINEVALVTKTNLNGDITFVNDSFIEVTGYSKDELIGQKHALIRDPKINEKILENIISSIHNGKTWEGKLKNYSKDGEEFYVYLTAIPIFDYDKRIKEFIWVRFLITEYEQEQKVFKEKVAKNIYQNRRINDDARQKIDELSKKLLHYKNLDNLLIEEQRRDSKFVNQISFYEDEIVKSEEKLKTISEMAKKKIMEVVDSERDIREKKIKTDSELYTLTARIEERNKEIKELTKMLDIEKRSIKNLELKIANKETI